MSILSKATLSLPRCLFRPARNAALTSFFRGCVNQNPKANCRISGDRKRISTALNYSLGSFRKLQSTRVFSTATQVPVPAIMEDSENDAPKEKFLKDYKSPEYLFDSVNLDFSVTEDFTTVASKIVVQPVNSGLNHPLVLDGVDLQLLSVKVNGQELLAEDYKQTKSSLTYFSPPQEKFELEITTKIFPQNNTSLEGLYKSSTAMLCTQCEAEGFRKITYYQDRPDVMSKFVTRVEADKELYPVLLSNGNLLSSGDAENGRHFAVWEDPFRKPCYLFALVAGKLSSYNDSFRTASGRDVNLKIWVQEQDLGKTEHAMNSLKAAMKWDEEVFGLEYDLDLFNIVAVPDFNMGAMENKGLNIFNSRLVLATPETATDSDYSSIEGVVAHEYFHNWTGNRVTCRDWFQLSLKEGLTVYRDQEFSADLNNRGVARIADVVRLRVAQFSQDAGPMAHPVRPESYIKMDNFYTVTVYEKGAEVVRMYEKLLGKDGFRKGMDLYFERHDGQAVTCDDFLAAMSDANNDNLSGFSLWLAQAGTPELQITFSFDESHKAFTLHCKQTVPATPGQPHKQPMLLPIAVGLLDAATGKEIPVTDVFDGESLTHVNASTAVLRMSKAEQEFTFLNVASRPVPSLLRDFSAPVKLTSDLTQEDLLFLLANDTDEFCRWEACQTVARQVLVSFLEVEKAGQALQAPSAFLQALQDVLSDDSLDQAFVARVLSLPSETELADQVAMADPDAIHRVHSWLSKTIASFLKPLLVEKVKSAGSEQSYSLHHSSMARRSLKNVCLSYLACLNEVPLAELTVVHFRRATNMTEQLGALAALCKNAGPTRDSALALFYDQWKDDNLVMNKWLSLQAASSIPNNVARCRKLLSHPAFNIKEPNKVYSLLGGFCSNPVNFHAKDGSGYQFLADMVLQLDPLNAQVAARMVSSFSRWKRYNPERQQLAKEQLERILRAENLSANVFEIVSKTLEA